MVPLDVLKKVVQAFEELQIPYFVTGSVASFMYGEPRFTNDADVVADLKEKHLSKLKRYFPEKDYYFDEEVGRSEIRRQGQFNIIHPASGFKIDIVIRKTVKFDASRFSRSKRLHPEESWEANFASPEDVIIKKMEYYKMGGSEKHLRDICGIFKISGGTLDRKYIERWSQELGLIKIWKVILSRLT